MPSASIPPGVADVLPADEARDPERWLAASCWATIVYCLLQILLFGFGRDHAAHALIGESLLRGLVPYRDAWDPSAPGIFFLHAALQMLLGKSMLALRLVEVLALLACVGCLRWLGGTLFGSKTAGLCGGALATLVHAQLEFWHTGQPETFAGFLTVGALLVTVRSTSSLRRQATILGFLAGALFLFKPALAAAIVVCGAYLARRMLANRGARAVYEMYGLLAVCMAIPVLSVMGWFAAHGALGELGWTLTTFASEQAEAAWRERSAPALFYQASIEALVGFSALIAAGTLAAVIMPPLYSREREGLFLIFGLLSVQLAGVAMAAEFLPHHFGASLPLLGLVSGLGWHKLWTRLAPSGGAGWLAFATFVIVVGAMREPPRQLPQSFWKRSALRTGYLLRIGPLSSREELDRELAVQGDYELASIRKVAREVGQRLTAEDSLYVGTDEPMVYWLSSARPANRYLRGDPQAAKGPHASGESRAGDVSGSAWSRKLERELEGQLPSYVVVRQAATAEAERHSPWLDSNYRKLWSMDGFVLYGRQVAAP